MNKLMILFLAASINLGLAEKECKKEDLQDCLNSLRLSLVDHFHDLGKESKDKYCQDLDQKKRCMDDALEVCHDKLSHMSYLISSLYIYLNQICTERAKTYMDIVPCLHDHASEFEKCKTDDKEHADPMEDICRGTDYFKCVATISRKVCDKGELYIQAVEENVANLQSNVCSNSACMLGVNHWKLMMLILIALFLIAQRIR